MAAAPGTAWPPASVFTAPVVSRSYLRCEQCLDGVMVVEGGGRWWKVVDGGGRWWQVVASALEYFCECTKAPNGVILLSGPTLDRRAAAIGPYRCMVAIGPYGCMVGCRAGCR